MGRRKDGGKMTKEQLKKLLPGMDREKLERVYEALRAEEKQLKEAAEQAQKETAKKDELLRGVLKKAQAYDEMMEKLEREAQEASEKQEEEEFAAQVEQALKARGALSTKAAMALLDMEALRASGNRKADIAKAVEELARSAEGAFLFAKEKTGRKVNIGGGRFGAAARSSETEAIRRAAGLK